MENKSNFVLLLLSIGGLSSYYSYLYYSETKHFRAIKQQLVGENDGLVFKKQPD